MWSMFVVSVLAGIVFLYIPGFLLLRACRLPRLTALVSAPLLSIVGYLLLCLLYAKLGVFSSWMTLVIPLFLVGTVALVAGSILGRGIEVACGARFSPDGDPRVAGGREGGWTSDWVLLGLYVLVGLVVSAACFALFLDGPDSFPQEYDNVHHLGVTLGFVQSGNWSPFAATLYASAADSAINPLPGVGYYPTAWNCLCALVVSVLGVSTALAANAVNFAFIAVVFPSGMFLLMRIIFPKKPGIVAWGSLCALAFSAFPWMLLLFGPLYPNMIAFCLLPLVLFSFMSLFSKGVGIAGRAAAALLFLLGMLCCAFAQPNAAFTAAVFLAPFCARQAYRAASRIPVPAGRQRLVQVACCAGACAAMAVVWYVLYKAPFLQSVVSHSWPAISSKPEAFVDTLLLGFRAGGVQVVLAALVIVGALYTLRRREYLWLSVSYAMMALLYIVDASSDGPLQHLLTGFWYTDSCRVAASAALFAISLASMGLWAAAQGLRRLAERMFPKASPRKIGIGGTCVVAVAFVLANYYPGIALPIDGVKVTALEWTMSYMHRQNDADELRVYGADERAFVQEALSVLPEDALLINVPDDGSAFAYAVDGARVYYRYLRTYGEEDETEESRLIRSKLSEISANQDVRDAVDKIGAEYLIVLDQGKSEQESPRLFTYENGKNWKGIDSVDDDTPGFEIVLSRDDMRLYRITAA
ncbi:MAG: hypothetical protein MEEGG_00923 [Eggerthella lenta]|uniref:DUF6541 family protein n=1 Tax=Eggerthella lenta TaxID=84112 RepID=UPI001F1A4F47|nr:DUF6541 family protein [Eggerthella lenta]